jgi:hypothetical protein
MSFSQVQIAIQNARAFGELKSLIENALSEANLDSFLHTLKRCGYKVREFDAVLQDHVLEQVPGASASKPGEELYAELGPSDQGMIREFYLTVIEQIPVEWRRKYQKLFQYA